MRIIFLFIALLMALGPIESAHADFCDWFLNRDLKQVNLKNMPKLIKLKVKEALENVSALDEGLDKTGRLADQRFSVVEMEQGNVNDLRHEITIKFGQDALQNLQDLTSELSEGRRPSLKPSLEFIKIGVQWLRHSRELAIYRENWVAKLKETEEIRQKILDQKLFISESSKTIIIFESHEELEREREISNRNHNTYISDISYYENEETRIDVQIKLLTKNFPEPFPWVFVPVK